MISEKAMAITHGKMVQGIRVNTEIINNMARGFYLTKKVEYYAKGSGFRINF